MPASAGKRRARARRNSGKQAEGRKQEEVIDEEPTEATAPRYLGFQSFFAVPADDSLENPAATVISRVRRLKRLQYNRLAQCIEVVRGRRDRLFVVSEHYMDNLQELLARERINEDQIQPLLFQVLQGLAAMNSHGLVHRNLTADAILMLPSGEVKIAGWAIPHLTQNGKYVGFGIGTASSMAPEVVLAGPSAVDGLSWNPKVDIWSLGILTLQMVQGRLWHEEAATPGEILQQLAELIGQQETGIPLTSKELHYHQNDRLQKWLSGRGLARMSPGLRQVINACLVIDPAERMGAQQLLEHSYFADLYSAAIGQIDVTVWPKISHTRRPGANRPRLTRQGSSGGAGSASRAHAFLWWTLSGGSLELVLSQLGGYLPSILRLSSSLCRGNSSRQKWIQSGDDSFRWDSQIVPILLDGAPDAAMPPGAPCAVVEFGDDWEQLWWRTQLFEQLLQGLPFTRTELIAEAARGIPVTIQGEVWAAVLGVLEQGNLPQLLYKPLSAQYGEAPGVADVQIDKDIPRCHQYYPLLQSSEGHQKLRRMLKVWVATHPKLRYWQGLDSLAAPFLTRHFDNEPVAYWCFVELVKTKVGSLFVPDNSAELQTAMYSYSQVLAFHDPVLANHFISIAFQPELYCIAWFLTLFAHVLPIEKTCILWDSVLVHPPQLVIYVAAAMAQQFRRQLLSYDFNGCVLFFSRNLSSVDIQTCVRHSLWMHSVTPPSIAAEAMAQPPLEPPSDLSRWWEQPMPTEIKRNKAYSSPRISVADMELAIKADSCKLVDVRPPELFKGCHVIGSVHCVANELVPQHSEWLSEPDDEQHEADSIDVIVVIGDAEDATLAAKLLTASPLRFVAILLGSIEAVAQDAPHLLSTGGDDQDI